MKTRKTPKSKPASKLPEVKELQKIGQQLRGFLDLLTQIQETLEHGAGWLGAKSTWIEIEKDLSKLTSIPETLRSIHSGAWRTLRQNL